MVLYKGWYVNSLRYMPEISYGLNNQLQVYHAEERFNRQYTVLEEAISCFHYHQGQEVPHKPFSLADFALKLVLTLSSDILDTITRKAKSTTAFEMLSRVWMGQESRYQFLHFLVHLLERRVHLLVKSRELIV